MAMRLVFAFVILLLFGCASSPAPESRYLEDNFKKSVSVTLNAPNLSALHKPPLNSGLAFLKVYDFNDVCEKRSTIFGEAYKQADPVGEIYVSKADRSKLGKLPLGLVVVSAGFDVHGVGTRMKCDRYFQFETRENFTYEIEVKESRPFVVSCSVSIKERGADGRYSDNISKFQRSENGGFLGLDDDLSPICGES
jgi:hypothetical protein